MNTEFSEFTNSITLYPLDLVSVFCHLVKENSVFMHLVNMLGHRHYARTPTFANLNNKKNEVEEPVRR